MSPGDVLVRADANRWWFPIVGSAVRGALVFAVFGIFFAVGGEVDVALGFPLVGLLIGACMGMVGSVLWLLGPARTTYEVTGGRLIARRGRRVRVSVPVDHVTDLTIHDDLIWRTMTVERMFSYAPFEAPSALIEVATGDRWSPENGSRSLPSILLWGRPRARQAEQELRQALGLDPAADEE